MLVRLPWIFLIPGNEAPDEYTHLWMIHFLRDHLRLPGAADIASGGPYAVYGSLPAFGYLPHVLITKFVPDGQVDTFARFGSLLAALVAVWAAYRVGQELFAESQLLSLSLPLLLVWHPQFVFVGSYANNDATAAAAGSVVIYFLIRLIKYGLTVRRTCAVACFSAWLALSKYSGFTVVPVVFIAFVWAAHLNGTALAQAIACAVPAALLFVGPIGAMLLRNHNEFAGDWLGTRTMYHTWAVTFHRQLTYHISPWQVIADKRWWRFFHFSFWAMFGYTTKMIWKPFYFVFLAFQLTSLGGWLKALQKRDWHGQDAKTKAVWTVLVLCLLFNLAGMVYASTENLGGPQGRYLFVCEIPFAAILLGGLAKLGPKASRWAVVSLLVFCALVCAGSWIMLFRSYGAFPTRLQ